METGAKAIDVLVRSGMKSQDFCLLVTKSGIALVREKGREEIRPGVFGYASFHIREHEHPSSGDIERAGVRKGDLMIPYDKLRTIHLVRGFTGSTMRREYIMVLDYLDESHHEMHLRAVLSPPRFPGGHPYGSQLRSAALSEYANEVKRILKEALPTKDILVAEV